MAYWLFKSEPSAFSIDDLARAKREWWDGVRNYQARNFMRDDMRVGDGVLFYHSSCPRPGIVGEARVCAAATPDATQFDDTSDYYDPTALPDAPRWWHVQIAFVCKFARMAGLQELRAAPKLAKMQILRRGNRLSITPVTAGEWRAALALAGAGGK